MATHHSFLQIPSATLLLCLLVAAAASLLPHPSHSDNISGSAKRARCIIPIDELHYFDPHHYRATSAFDGGSSGSLDSRYPGRPVRENTVASLHTSFIVLYDDNKKASSPRVVVRRFRRTIRNVGKAGGGVYKVDVVAPRGSSVSVHPKTLTFVKKNEKKRYTLTVKYVKDKKGSVSQGWISWNEVHGKRKVRSPIIIAPLEHAV